MFSYETSKLKSRIQIAMWKMNAYQFFVVLYSNNFEVRVNFDLLYCINWSFGCWLLIYYQLIVFVLFIHFFLIQSFFRINKHEKYTLQCIYAKHSCPNFYKWTLIKVSSLKTIKNTVISQKLENNKMEKTRKTNENKGSGLSL